MRPTGSPEELEHRRIRAAGLLDRRYEPVEVARIIGVDRRSVRRWKAAYLKNGLKALKAKSSPGRPPKLTEKQKEKLEELLLKGARASGFLTDLWTCPRIAHLIWTHFHVEYHVDHVGRLLRSLGWSPQKPQRKALERDEKAIRRWVKHEWPRIKKKPHP